MQPGGLGWRTGKTMVIDVERSERGILTVTINNPAQRNALNLQVLRALADLWPRVASDKAVRAVVLTGAGEDAFCAGADLSGDMIEQPGFNDLVENALLKTAFMPKPLVAAINGHCIAGGLELALAADIRIAREDAKFGLPEVRWGLVPSAGGTLKLAEQIGHAAAMDLLLTARLIDGREAARIGLVTLACPAAEVRAIALARAEMIAANSPVAVRAAKRMALAARLSLHDTHAVEERRITMEVRASGHFRIGAAAFMKKSQPVYDDE
jgi:enoyl-CoA hydratase/carnithine racemase